MRSWGIAVLADGFFSVISKKNRDHVEIEKGVGQTINAEGARGGYWIL